MKISKLLATVLVAAMAYLVPVALYSQETFNETQTSDLPTALSAEGIGIVGADACLNAARQVIPSLERSEFGLSDGRLCDEGETEFLSILVSYRSSAHVPTGLPVLFWQRTPGHQTAIREGREPRLSYAFTPFDAPDMWAITVTDSLGNKREGQDFLWARDLRDAIDGSAPATNILGEPLVYFTCSEREGQTCVAYYNIDKCYGDPEYPRDNSAANRQFFQLSVAAIGPDNVERMFSNYAPTNRLAEGLLEILTPSVCAYQQIKDGEF